MSLRKVRAFRKYESQGAYHWRDLNPVNFRKYNPRLQARYQAILQIVQKRLVIKNAVGLDVGCGDGVLYERFSRHGAKMVGIDYENFALIEATRHLEHPRLSYATVYRLPFVSAQFDFAVISEVIEHLETPQSVLPELVRILKPGGLVILTTPHRRPSRDLHSNHHVHEFRGYELRSLLSSYFENTSVWGLYPLSLLRQYKGRKLNNRIVRVLIKTASILGFNPFETYQPLGEAEMDHLIAVGYSP